MRATVAVFTHQTCDATQGRQTPEGVHLRTLWGELAWQLGGQDLYRIVEANDQARSVPQGLFADVLRQAVPCLILLDELAHYCVGASAVEVGQGTLADQTISFIEHLTQAVQQVPGVAVVATLPASHLEVAGSDRGQEILTALEGRFGSTRSTCVGAGTAAFIARVGCCACWPAWWVTSGSGVARRPSPSRSSSPATCAGRSTASTPL